MRRICFFIISLVVLFSLYFGSDHWGLINISNVASLFVPAIVILIMAVPVSNIVPLWGYLITMVPLFLGLKSLVGSSILNDGLTVTGFELLVLVTAITVGYFLISKVREIEKSVSHLYLGSASRMVEPFSARQGVIYREVKRARNYRRPLALMAIGVDDETVRANSDRLVEEMKRQTVKQIALTNVAWTLTEMLDDCTIIAKEKDHFLVLLPEITAEVLPDLSENLCKAVQGKLGFSLCIGTASLDKDGWTFAGLLQKAVDGMKSQAKSVPEVETLAPMEGEFSVRKAKGKPEADVAYDNSQEAVN